MKKYKLIKKYPSLPEDWEVGMEIMTHCEPHQFVASSPNYSLWFIDIKDIERYPEFWEEVVEKEYEILIVSFEHSDWKFTTSNRKIDIKAFEDGKLPYWSIQSIKRLSDGEVFTVGDKVKIHGHNIYEIKKIEISEFYKSKLHIVLSTSSGNAYSIYTISHINKTESVLTTEDGVDIYRGNSMWFVGEIIDAFKRLRR